MVYTWEEELQDKYKDLGSRRGEYFILKGNNSIDGFRCLGKVYATNELFEQYRHGPPRFFNLFIEKYDLDKETLEPAPVNHLSLMAMLGWVPMKASKMKGGSADTDSACLKPEGQLDIEEYGFSAAKQASDHWGFQCWLGVFR